MKLKNKYSLLIIMTIFFLIFLLILFFINEKTISNFYKEMIINIITALIGAYAVVKMTNKQIKESRNIDNERLIIEHKPILNYSFLPYGKYSDNVKVIIGKSNKGIDFRYNLIIENNGLDIVRDFGIEFISDFYKDEKVIAFDIIKKGDKEEVSFVFNHIEFGDYKIKNIITYEDILGDLYSQEIEYLLRVYEQEIDVTNIIVKHEKLIQKENIF